MKGLIIKDFLNLRNNIKTMLITILIYLLFFISYDPSFLSGLLIMIFCLQRRKKYMQRVVVYCRVRHQRRIATARSSSTTKALRKVGNGK